MAAAFFSRMAPDDVRAESAGRQPRREGVWPTVVEAMREIGVDLSTRRPQKLSVEMQLHDVPVRSFVMAIADRQARECLATGGCAVAV